MPLNASGPISLAGATTGQSIAVQLNQSSTGQISLNDSAVRGLAGVASGQISMPSNFWGKGALPSLTYVASTMVGGSGTSKTFSGFAIGSASSTRRVIVAVSIYGTGTNISSVTVAGQATTKLVQQTNGGTMVGIFITNSAVSSGTTADVVVNISASSSDRWAISTYSAKDLSSITPVGTGSTTSNNGSVTLSGSADGVMVGVGGASGYNGSGGSGSATNMTLNAFLDGYSSYGVGMYASAASRATATTTSYTVSMGINDNYQPAFAYASLR